MIYVNGERSPSESDSDYESRADHIEAERKAARLVGSQPKAFYASESGGLKLAGADIFSPAISGPPSPSSSRMSPFFEVEKTEGKQGEVFKQGLRHRLAEGNEGSISLFQRF